MNAGNRPAAAEAAVSLEVQDVVRHFSAGAGLLRTALGTGRSVKAVDGVSLRIRRGQTLGLVGESGCGKSTLARLVAGLDRPNSGRIHFADAGQAGHRVQMVFQDPYASLNPRYRIGSAIAEPIRFQKLLPKAEVPRRVHELLLQVGLAPADALKFPHEFSGGQRQRVSIARALAGAPSFLVCDEPTSALDVSVQAQILNLLRRLQEQLGLSCLFISHNLAVVNYMSHSVGVMYLGRLAELAPTRVLFDAPKHPYTQLLLAALPRLDRRGREKPPAPGEIPSPLDPPPGCGFHPRCPHGQARCQSERPALVPLPDGSQVACHAVQERRIPMRWHTS
ncbi:ABC transporter ATP-binding protein [Verminephrobacter aporrectodeae subsp. tuberculatae]|uniref:ABC transporter ATP-binding protein n=2 Tax=Verminephrobacter aporrectodeae TaxID=1110389 RepID=UPI002237D113|nr:ABC transporter ATP-binding protein [Verminephrobacter aporrectodeae]MCW5221199.1 ABC transporter ATP-binding protein [Verminephrobacter aporrectodeae subsp. tuberculatae]MCW5290490.1 ABC transporter ATP-binding protein [Verminephrobacter aporrectodeae subsp. tuberculatae]